MEQRALRAQLGGLTKERNRQERLLEIAELAGDRLSALTARLEIDAINSKIESVRSQLREITEPPPPPPIKPPYQEVEYARYYRYMPSEKYKQRHFEARAVFILPQGVDPDSAAVYNLVEKIFDDEIMRDRLGIRVGEEWDIDWVSGSELKGTTKKYNRTVDITVVDKLRRKIGPYRESVTVEEGEYP